MADQLIWKKPGATDGVGVFARVMGAPPDRTLVDVSVQGGVTCRAPFADRENDTAGIASIWARIGPNASKSDTDTIGFAFLMRASVP